MTGCTVMVSVDKVVVVAAEIPATVCAEFCRLLGATLLVLLQLIGAAESTDIANFHFLTCLD
jgi:hypothetical protein